MTQTAVESWRLLSAFSLVTNHPRLLSRCHQKRPIAIMERWAISNNGQVNLATGGIAANWGFRAPNLPFQWANWGPCLTQCYFGPRECPCQRRLIMSDGFSRVHECDRWHACIQTDIKILVNDVVHSQTLSISFLVFYSTLNDDDDNDNDDDEQKEDEMTTMMRMTMMIRSSR